MIDCKYYDGSEPIELIDDTLISCGFHGSYQKIKEDCKNCQIKHGKLYVLFSKGIPKPYVCYASYDKQKVINEYNKWVGKNKEFERLYWIKVFEEVEE